MTAEELAEVLEDLLRSVADDEEGDAAELQGARIQSYRRAGVLTADAGFVLELADGSEFQVSAVQSRIGSGEDDEP